MDKNTPWNGGIVAMNSFGFGGANVHLALKSNPKNKPALASKQAIARLVTVSGRTEAAVEHLLDAVDGAPVDPEFYALLGEVHKNDIVGHPFRGYTVLGETENQREVLVSTFT